MSSTGRVVTSYKAHVQNMAGEGTGVKKVVTRYELLEIIFAVLIIMGALSMVIPFLWMISASLKNNVEFYEAAKWIPKQPQWINYTQFFTAENVNFPLYFFNTVKITFFSSLGLLFSCSITAFAMARIRFPGRELLFSIALLSMFLPPQVTLIPIFIIMNKIGWYNTHLPLIMPSFFGNAFGIFLLRQFFKSVPAELDEAAKINGCSMFGIYYKIHLPLIKPALITLAIMHFQTTWGEILKPLIYLADDKLYTLTIGLRQLTQRQYRQSPATAMAGYVLLIIPVMVIYIFCQRYFTESIRSTGIKG